MASEYPFNIQMQPSGYQDKVSPDLVDGTWLCEGSQNMLIAPDGTVQTRKGLSVVGDEGAEGSSPVYWAQTWNTNTGVELPLRTIYDKFQVLYKDVWRDVATGFGKRVFFDAETWWDKTEIKDKFLFVNGENTIRMWTGGIAEAYSATTTTLTKKYVTPRSEAIAAIVFNAAGRTITASWLDFTALGFVEGDTINVIGGGSPNVGSYKVKSVTATVITLTDDEVITDETNVGAVAAPSAVAQNRSGGTLSASTAYYYRISAVDAYGGETLASTEVTATTTTSRRSIRLTWTPVTGATSYKIYRSTTSGSYTDPALLKTVGGDTFTDDGSVTLSAGTIPSASSMGVFVAVKGRETWASERFASTGEDLSFMHDGIKYTYTGGFNSPTLTGITPNLPTVDAGDIIFSAVTARGPFGGDIPGNGDYDILAVNENQMLLGSTTNRSVFMSKNTNYLDYGYTAGVRKHGEGGTIILDNEAKSIDVSDEGQIHITAGKTDVYTVTLESTTTGTTAGEELRVKKIKNSRGQAAVGPRAVTNTKNGLAYLSSEPSVDYLARVAAIETQQGLPISDPIERLIRRLDSTNVDTLFHLGILFILFPAEGTLLMYDTIRQIWQPPQLVAGSSLSVIGGELCVHSSTSSTTFKMFSDVTDNGYPITYHAVYNYRNGGDRATYKTASKYFTELRINGAAEGIITTVDLGYAGLVASASATISADDGPPYIESPSDYTGIGVDPIGSSPFGGFYADDSDEALGVLLKARRVIPLPELGSEFFEMRFRVSCDSLGTHFQILAHGENMMESESVISNLIKED